MFLYDPGHTLPPLESALATLSTELDAAAAAVTASLTDTDQQSSAHGERLSTLANRLQYLQAGTFVVRKFEANEATLAERGLSETETTLARYRLLVSLATRGRRDDTYSGRSGDCARSFNEGLDEAVADLQTWVSVLDPTLPRERVC